MKRIPLLIIGATLVAGCSTTPESKPEPEATVIETKQARVTRDLTLSWDNMGRGGAAIRQPGYIHVLGEGNIHGSGSKASLPPSQVADPYTPSHALEAVAQIDRDNRASEIAAKKAIKVVVKDSEPSTGQSSDSSPKEGYSLYELNRWERFCDNGKGMDEADWKFVSRNGGAQNIPVMLRKSCDVPSHDYKTYLAAWTGFCTGSGITSTQRDIVRESVRPKSRVNPCKALSK